MPLEEDLFQNGELEVAVLHDLRDVVDPVIEREQEAQVRQNHVVRAGELATLPDDVGFEERFDGVVVVDVLLTDRGREEVVRCARDGRARREFQGVVPIPLFPVNDAAQEGVDIGRRLHVDVRAGRRGILCESCHC